MQLSESPGLKDKCPVLDAPFFSSPGGSLFGVDMETKVCCKCGNTKQITEYHKKKSHKDGLSSWCKSCEKIRAHAYHIKNSEECNARSRKYYRDHCEELNAKSRVYREIHHEEIAAQRHESYQYHRERIRLYNRKWYAKNCEEIKANVREYAQQYPERTKARNAVNNAIRDGKLIRPDRCSNIECNKPCEPEGHHYLGYAKKHWLDVEWLCHSCHLILHAKLNREMGKCD